MGNQMQRSQQHHQLNLKSSSMQNSTHHGDADGVSTITGSTQTANQSLSSVRNRTCTESSSNVSPQKEIKRNSGSLDATSSNNESKGRPKKDTNVLDLNLITIVIFLNMKIIVYVSS